MRGTCRVSRVLAVVALSISGMSAAAAADSTVLDRLSPGAWEIRERNPGGSRLQLCIANGHGLVQLRHPGPSCPSVVSDSTAEAVTVTYSCPGNGYGRTRVRVESPQLAQIESQGVVNRTPFVMQGEARRVGPCAH